MGTVFHLVRHASHDLVGRVLVGRGPVALSEAGQREAGMVSRMLAGAGLAGVVTSPQPRAQQTAAVIAARTGVAVTVDPGLDELDFGAWTGAAFDALQDDPCWRAFNTFRGGTPIPGGETMLAVQARAVGTVLRLRDAHPDTALALVSHADVLKAVLAHFLGMPLDLIGRIELAPASRSLLTVFETDAVVQGVNERVRV